MSARRIGSALLAVMMIGACQWLGLQSPAAQLREMHGQVTVTHEGDEAAEGATVDMGLWQGDLVATGEESSAVLEFQGGTAIRLDANASVVIRTSGVATADIGVILLGGSAKATSAGEGYRIVVGTPFGMTELGDRPSTLELDHDAGINVLVGQVEVLLPDGGRQLVAAGNSLTIDGLVVPIGTEPGDPEDEADLVLEPITVVLLANPKQVQVKRAGQEKWRAPKKRDLLAAGDSLRTRRASSTHVQLGETSGVTLQGGTTMTLDEAGEGENRARAAYTLSAGTVDVSIARNEDMLATHDVQAGGNKITVMPGPLKAKVQVTAGKKGRARVSVRAGKVELEDGTVIEAGSSANLKDGKTEGEVRAVAITRIGLRPGSSTVVNYRKDVPAIALAWKGDGDQGPGRYVVEVARDKTYSRRVIHEEVTKTNIVTDQIKPGRYWWRVKTARGLLNGTFKVQKGSASGDCPKCERVNDIHDTGEKTVVYYQQKLPAISLHWKAVAGAASYRVKVFRDGEFDAPHADSVVQQPKALFGSGKLHEGKFYWLVVSRDAAGKDISTGRMNSLEIAYDNAVVDLSIKSPLQAARTTKSSITTSGVIQMGARLSINGRNTPIDGSGRFSQRISLSRGANQVVYRSIAADGIERYYIRDVYRK